MSDVVTTTGRPMTRRLQDALDDLTGLDRAAVRQAFTESATPVLAPVYQALAVELRLCDLRDADLLLQHSRELQADRDALPEPPYPPASGPAVFGVVEPDGTLTWQPMPKADDTPGLPDVPPAA
jgi:hypothetical protein